jgi:hypothetical protein
MKHNIIQCNTITYNVYIHKCNISICKFLSISRIFYIYISYMSQENCEGPTVDHRFVGSYHSCWRIHTFWYLFLVESHWSLNSTMDLQQQNEHGSPRKNLRLLRMTFLQLLQFRMCFWLKYLVNRLSKVSHIIFPYFPIFSHQNALTWQ